MNQNDKNACRFLRKMSSHNAAEWLIATYPISNMNWGYALSLIPHRSWEKKDQLYLANYYLQKIPFSSKDGYEAFTTIMSISNLVKVIRNYLPKTLTDARLLDYYLIPILKKHHKNASDIDIIEKLEFDLANIN